MKSGTWNTYHNVTVYEELLELTVEHIGLPNFMRIYSGVPQNKVCHELV
jgi:hypothetical protein